ncbi:ribosomal-protein-alanine acetyltransferase [Litchfieldella qijiaojingensis]|uniref:Ribosomal-protein-alanine acetyltransferase n=1 Tax=Litchfieldella qijiaojingensis TaxID=980347 RepID=A0ABQ2YWN0_9GAMM|nr:ribosomal protein S18-alanine N-acetyltransferase [Halomonas qijiaojingensis]GGX97801.1 ribosomal-protein-alanine acetyltransferase [Halomonas qijiaojingensis]
MTEPILCRLGAAHLASLIELEQAGQPHPWSPAQLAAVLTDPQASAWGALEVKQQSLLGFAVLYRLPFDAELQAITVAPWVRRQGIARALLIRLCEEAEAWGSERLLLEVRASNAAAIALYRQLAFEVDGRRRGYYPASAERAGHAGTREDALLMSRRL